MSSPTSFTLPAATFGDDQQLEQHTAPEPTTPRTVDIVQELRSATSAISAQISAQISARLDGFNLRLGDMERQYRIQQSQPGSPSPNTRIILPSTSNAPTAAPARTDQAHTPQDEAPPANLTIHRGAPRVRLDAPVPPHMSRAAAALATSVPPPTARSNTAAISLDALNPLDRYKSMKKGEKANIRRALAGIGLSIPTLAAIFSNAGDDVETASTTGSVEDSAASSATHLSTQGLHQQSTSVESNTPQLATNITSVATPTTVQSAPLPAPQHTSVVVPAHTSSIVAPVTSHITESPSPVPPPTLTPTPNIEPAPNISVVASTPTSVAISTRTMTCKTEWIGDYDGDPTQLEDFLTRLRDLIRSETQADLIPTWITAVLRTLPRTLKGNAAVWHQGLSDTDAARLTSFDAWCSAMRDAFPVNRQQLKRDAWTRKWNPTEETAMGYYFHKVRLLRQTFGKDAAEDTLVNDIKDGLPESMVALLRLPRKGATLTELITELGDWEPNWRKQYKIPLHPATTTATSSTSPSVTFKAPAPAFTPAAARILQQTMGRSASAPSTPVPNNNSSSRVAPSNTSSSKPISKFAANYDPTRVIPAQNGQPRRYRPPGKDTVMDLRAPCTSCGGDHFNFEHDYIVVPQVRIMAADEDDYVEYPWDGHAEEDGEGGNTDPTDPSLSLEPGIAPSMFPTDTSAEIQSTLKSSDDTTTTPASPCLFFTDKSIFSVARTLRPNESAPPLAQEKRAFGRVVILPKHSATGTGQGYRDHVPLTTHVRINDTDGRAMSSLLDTGASLSCIDAALLEKMGGKPQGERMKIHGVGSSETLGWVTIPLFIAAQDPHGKHVHLEVEQDFHVLPTFLPGLCLGLDFIDAHEISISPVRGRARLGRYTFQVHERLEKPFVADAELRTTAEVTIPPNTQTWVQVNAATLAPGVDYLVIPRLSVTPDQAVCLLGPNGLVTHGPVRHILIGNYGTESFQLEQDTIVADATAARVGDSASAAGETFTLHPRLHTAEVPPPPTRPEDAAMPFDPFEDIEPYGSSLVQDAATGLVDGTFKVGLDAEGQPHPEIAQLLRDHPTAFALDGRPGRVDGFDMPINLKPDAALRSEAPRRASPEKRAAMDAAIDQLLDWDVIEPSDSSVSFPVVMVKQQSKWRFCVDYRNLNTDTIPDRYPLPVIDSIFHTLCGKKIFSSLDAIRGYHQLGVREEDRWKTAFVCHRGLYQYKRIPFGLRNAPSFFQRFMDKVLGPLRWNQAIIYIDDAVVATDTMAEHLAALKQLFESAESVGLKFSPAKCTFGVPSLVLLGRKVSGAGVAIWKDRAQAVEHLPRPTTLQELYHTLGLFGYYRAFIPRFAALASPLTGLLKGWRYECADGQSRLVNTEGKAVTASKVPIPWDAAQQTSFDTIKLAITQPPVLAHPDPTKPYILYTDASKDALGAILHQVHSEPVPITPPQAPPAGPALHALSIPQFSSDLVRRHWEAWLAADPHFGPILRRLQASSDSDDEWVLKDGILTRRLDDRIALPEAAVPFVMRAIHDERGHFGFTKTFLAAKRHFWRPSLSSMVRAWVKHCVICQQTKQVPKVGRLDISKDSSFPFEAISFDLMYGFPRAQSGNDAVLAIHDLFSRMILLTPCHKDITAEGIAAIVADRVLRLGWRPKRLIADSESRVSGSVLSSLAASLGAVLTPSSPYHQQANAVERAIQTVQQVLRAMAVDSKSYWDKRILPAVELAMNSTPSLTTGFRPFDLVFLSHPDVIHAVFDDREHLGVHSFDERLAAASERLTEAHSAINAARLDQKRRYDSRRAAIPELRTGMRVWVRLKDRPIPGTVHDKLDARKDGPFEVVEIISPHRVRLRLPADYDIDPVFSVEQLDFLPSTLDPFANDRPLALHSPPPGDDVLHGRGTPSSPALSDSAPVDEVLTHPDPPLAPRVRRAPGALRDFQLGAMASVGESQEVVDVLRGPLVRPRRLTIDGKELVYTERPVAFLSRLTGVAERKLVAPELELVCLAWAFHKLAHLLEGASVTVVTDHAPMERMLTSTSGVTYGPTITRCRALLLPQLDNLRFVYRPGPKHTNVDALSRLPIDQGRSSSGGGDVLAGDAKLTS